MRSKPTQCRFLLLVAPVLGFWVGSAGAQVADSLQLPDARVEAARSSVSAWTAPFSIAVLERDEELTALNPELSLDAILAELPGLWASNRSHLALGERLSVRGMGARAAFGVRGVQVVLDGIPLTMPDGQAITDVVDPALVRRAELIRGPASIFWGNAGGGVLSLSTIPPKPDATNIRTQALGGSFGLHRLAAQLSMLTGRNHLYVHASTFGQNGYRDYSDGRLSRGGLFADFSLADRTRLVLTGAAAIGNSEHPGSLTRLEMAENPRAANPGFVQTESGKESTHAQIGVTLHHALPRAVVSATTYGVLRDLDNPLPFAYIRLQRRAGGLRLTLRSEQEAVDWGIGADAAIQRDDRENWNNVDGEPEGDIELDQVETVRDAAAFAYARYRLQPRLTVSGGLRIDIVRFSMEDGLLSNADQSGNRTFVAWTPSFGLAYRFAYGVFYTGYGVAFETPTTTELVNRPDGHGGFNNELDPQRTQGLEAGFRGFWPAAGLFLDAALYYLRVDDRLVPFQTASGGDRTFYRNAGRNGHAGVELAARWRATSFLLFQSAYTLSYLHYVDEDLSGNRVPGVPLHRVFGAVTFSKDGFFNRVTLRAAGGYYADDSNAEPVDGYAVMDLAVGHEGLQIDQTRLQPFVQVRNVTDKTYAGSVQVNAFSGRYFEPAPGRSFRLGVSLAF